MWGENLVRLTHPGGKCSPEIVSLVSTVGPSVPETVNVCTVAGWLSARRETHTEVRSPNQETALLLLVLRKNKAPWWPAMIRVATANVNE